MSLLVSIRSFELSRIWALGLTLADTCSYHLLSLILAQSFGLKNGELGTAMKNLWGAGWFAATKQAVAPLELHLDVLCSACSFGLPCLSGKTKIPFPGELVSSSMAVAMTLKCNLCQSAVAWHQMPSFLFAELIKKSSAVYPSMRLQRLQKQLRVNEPTLPCFRWFPIVQAINF